MPDELLRRVVEVFGPLAGWKRGADPDTEETKGFAFATFSSPGALLHAARVLNGMPVSSTHTMVVNIGSKLLAQLKAWTEEQRAPPPGSEEGEAAPTTSLPMPPDTAPDLAWIWRVTPPEHQEGDALGGKVADILRADAGGGGGPTPGTGQDKVAALKDMFSHRQPSADGPAAAAVVVPAGSGNSGADVHMPVIDEGVVSAIDAFREKAAVERARKTREKVRAAREAARHAKEAQERGRSPPPSRGDGKEREGGGGPRRGHAGDRDGGGRYDRRPTDTRFVDEDSDDDGAPADGTAAPVAQAGTALAPSSAARALEAGAPITIALGAGGGGETAPSSANSATLPPPPSTYEGWVEYPLPALFAAVGGGGLTSAVTAAVSGVVDEQLTELLGEVEDTMKTFILAQVKAGLPGGAAPMHAELALVLDDDAGGLVAAVLNAVHGVATG